MKQSQASMYTGIAIMCIILVVLLMFSALRSREMTIEKLESVNRNLINNGISVSTLTTPYVTFKGIPLEELFWVYSCYKDETLDYGQDIKFNFLDVVREKFDEIYSSMINGQRSQAINQLKELGLDNAPEVIDYLSIEINQPEIALDLIKSYFRITTR